jgi:hypothetical protein
MTRALPLVLLFVSVPLTVRLEPPALPPTKFGSSATTPLPVMLSPPTVVTAPCA